MIPKRIRSLRGRDETESANSSRLPPITAGKAPLNCSPSSISLEANLLQMTRSIFEGALNESISEMRPLNKSLYYEKK